MIREPCFAYNVVGREGDAKWSPPEWAVDVEDHIVEALTPHYQKLTELMTGQRIEIWKSMIEFQWDYYSQLCLEITRDSPSLLHHWQVAEDFVCGIFEEREDEETYSRLLRSSIRDEVVEQLGILQDG